MGVYFLLPLDLSLPFLSSGVVLLWGRDGSHDGPFLSSICPATSLRSMHLGYFATCGLLRGGDGRSCCGL